MVWEPLLSLDQYPHITETLLTAFSGSPLNVIRRSSDTPLFVKEPCVNIIGTTQTALLGQISDKWMNNGFLDRVVFVHPKQAAIPLWEDEDEGMLRLAAKAHGDWASLISRICELKKDKPQAVLSFTPEARARFFRWQNSIISSVNALPEEALAETREMKRCHIAAKIALILQIMRHACGEAGKDAVDLRSVESAIMANEHFEESYETFKRAIGMQSAGCAKKSQFIALCQGEFTAADAQNVGKRLSINERTVKRWLKDLSEKGEFERLAHGIYRRK
ncbi:MAG: DUF3987 domain-containing protein, partial [Oscillospiraceae bacterium]|nr:DUF3987 domain-containing protein [Oscillospiraceae bacterium]